MRLTARFLAVCAALTAVGASAVLADGCASPSCSETATCPDAPDSEVGDQTVVILDGGPDADATAQDADAATTDASGADAVEDSSADAPNIEGGACSCIAQAPQGWQGPGIVYESANPLPSDVCGPAGWRMNFMNYGGGLQSPDLNCQCGCDPPDGAACTPPSINVYSDSQCTNSCGTGGPAVCTPAAQHCSSGGQSAGVTVLPTPTGQGVCSPNVQRLSSSPAATWSFYGEGCLPPNGFSTCDAGFVCASDPPSGFVPQHCVWIPEDMPCPDSGPYQIQYRQYFTGIADNRTCNVAQCSCGTPTAVSCSLVGAAVYSTAGCTNAGTSLSKLGLETGSGSSAVNCSEFPAGGIQSVTTDVLVSATCAQLGNATTAGTASGSGTVETVCCAPQ